MKYKKQMPAILWAFFIAFLCGIPGKDLPSSDWLELISFDKFVHASLFYILVLLSNKAYNTNNISSIRILIFILCCLYGGLLEILQGTIFSERSADIYDFIANSFGALIALLMLNRKDSKSI